MSKQTNPSQTIESAVKTPSVPLNDAGRPKIKRLFFKENVFVGIDNVPTKTLAQGGENWAQSDLSFSPDYRFLRIEHTKSGVKTVTLVPIENIASIMLDT